MINIDILSLIPQKPPFIAVEHLLFCEKEKTTTSFTVRNDSLFIENGALSEMGIIENIAQTCAARLGYINRDKSVKIGMIASVSNLEIFSRPKVNSKIETTINVIFEMDDIRLIEAQSTCEGKLVTSCEMKVFLTDIVVRP